MSTTRARETGVGMSRDGTGDSGAGVFASLCSDSRNLDGATSDVVWTGGGYDSDGDDGFSQVDTSFLFEILFPTFTVYLRWFESAMLLFEGT